MREEDLHKKLMSVLFPVLALLLAACSTTGSTSSSQATVVPTSSPQASTSTPSITPLASTVSSTPVQPLTAIRMLDIHNGWALTASSILKTTDGGQHWNDVTPANAGLNQDARGQFLNTQDAWIAIGPANQQEGPGIAVLHTAEGGASWQRSLINDPRVSRVDVPHFINTRQGWIEISSTPGAGSAGSDIWHSNDELGSVTGNLGAGGDNTVPSIALTHNGGQSWQTQALPHLLGGYVNPMNTSQPPVFFGNVAVLPVTITAESGPVLVLYRSNDGGVNWFQTSAAPIQAEDTYVVDPNHAWATDTPSGKLYSTSDGGNHWSLTSNTVYQMNALSFTDAQNGWGVTRNHLLQTTDGGKTWQQIPYTIQ
jgi:photosystem II stability/assembly factor-like uncharacterized protein